MTQGEILILLALGAPTLSAVLAYVFHRAPDVRDTVIVVCAIVLAFVGWGLFSQTSAGVPPELMVGEPAPGFAIAFRLEPLGALFAAMASGLWALTSLYAIGYMRGAQEQNQTRFYACLSIAMVAVMGVAMAANLFTLFVFYEVLSLSTYPLVAHKGDEASRKAGRIYVGILLGASVTLLLPGLAAIAYFAGSTDFVDGGLLAGTVSPTVASILILLVVFGAAKGAMFPLHGWLPSAMVAPTPVSAMLHAVAVVKTGVFTILKATTYIFGSEVMASAPATDWLVWLASGVIVWASLVAITKPEIKARLAWSTIAQLAYIIGGALIAVERAVTGAALHMLTHGFGKITLFMCAGAIYVATGLTRIEDMRGLGRRMPVVFIAFLVGTLSIMGMPPTGGLWSKFMLIGSAFDAGAPQLAWAMVASSVLAVFYLGPVLLIAMFPAEGAGPPAPFKRAGGAPGLAVAPLAVTAIGAIALFFLAGPAAERLQALWGSL
ncbi:monovalent cation/H+ antiporter subunit D family protein [bacterium]|nr:monovalent cation/H+ antiporter subunit D family protein [bacterium]